MIKTRKPNMGCKCSRHSPGGSLPVAVYTHDIVYTATGKLPPGEWRLHLQPIIWLSCLDHSVLHFLQACAVQLFIIFFICQKRRRATRKAEAHHTLVAHYMTIVNVRIKHTTHTSTYKHSKQVYHSTHYTLTHTQTQNNHLKCRPKSTLLVTVLQQLCYGHEYCCDCFFWSKDISLGSRYE